MILPVSLILAAGTTLAGSYDGSQMEMAAGLELRADGRFRYALSVGALDESASGHWTAEGDYVILTSDPVTPPRITLVEEKPEAPGRLGIALDAPKGVSHQYFDAEVKNGDGQTARSQLQDDGPLILPIDPKNPPVAVRIVLPLFDLAGPFAPVTADKGYGLRFRFEPNDIGKVDFQGARLDVDKGGLLLDWHGRAIRFRRISPDKAKE